MFMFLSKQMKKNKKGFTLIELIVVVAILGILALIAVPRFIGIKDNAQLTANKATATTILNAAEVAYQNGLADADCQDIDKLVEGGYLRSGTYTGYSIDGSAGTYNVSYPGVNGGTGGTVGN